MRARARVTTLLLAVVGVLACDPYTYLSGVTWRLVPNESSIHFIGIKDDAVAVPGSFTSLDGVYDGPKGMAYVEVKLDSTETGNPERDQNLRTFFFETPKYPIARFEVQGLPGLLDTPANNRLVVNGTLDVHGTKVPLSVPLRVSLEGRTLHVRTATTVVLYAKNLGLGAQLVALKAVCGHQTLSDAIPFDVDLSFTRVSGD